MTSVLKTKQLRIYPHDKTEKLNEYVNLLSKYTYTLLTDVTGIPAPTLHEIRRKLRERNTTLKVVKNRIFAKALEKVFERESGQIHGKLTGQTAIIFTNENPFSLIIFLRKEYKMTRQAKPGDTATGDIIIPAGNTGIAPGPTMSLFNKLKVPIRVQEGSIWVTADTVVAKKGDLISIELAELLSKLGIKPIEITLPIKALTINDRVIDPNEIEYEPEIYTNLITNAYSQALNLAINALVPIQETTGIMLARAHHEAKSLAITLALPLPEVMELCLVKAHLDASVLFDVVKKINTDIN
ncbi:MAG: 50S ribosomal protein L10 [Thermofilaceae archaeon]|nr:50S ribosomal protein L10 [Thermofilaceae archaeon]